MELEAGNATMKMDAATIFLEQRPDINKEVEALMKYRQQAVVFACGPSVLTKSCLDACDKFNVEFHTEMFEF